MTRGDVHEHSGNGDIIAGAGLDARHGVGGLPPDAETRGLEDRLSHNPHNQPDPAQRPD